MHAPTSWPVTLESSLAVAQQMQTIEIGHASPTHNLDTSFKYFDAARILLDAQLDSQHSILDPDLLQNLTENGIDRADETRRLSSTRSPLHQQASMVLAAKPSFDWLCHQRGSGPTDIEAIADAQLSLISTGLQARLAWLIECEFIDASEPSQHGNNGAYGLLFEEMVLGMLAESEEFRKAGIISVPAGPNLEALADDNPSPKDLALYHAVDGKAEFIGGIQCKAKRPASQARRVGPNESTSTVYLYGRQRFKLAGDSLRDIISTWIEGDDHKLEYLHDRLAVTITESKHHRLKELLGYS